MTSRTTPYPQQFRDDVVRLVVQENLSCAQAARDMGVSSTAVARWVRQAEVEAGNRPGLSSQESAEINQLRKRNRLLEQENEVLRRAAAYLAQGMLPK